MAGYVNLKAFGSRLLTAESSRDPVVPENRTLPDLMTRKACRAASVVHPNLMHERAQALVHHLFQVVVIDNAADGVRPAALAQIHITASR